MEFEAALQVQSVKKVLFTTVRKISTTFSFVIDVILLNDGEKESVNGH